MGDVSEKFLTPMLVFFSLPNSAQADRETFLGGYIEELGNFTNHELAHAAKLLRTTRTTRTLPTLADCLDACKQARDTLQPPVKKRQQERGVRPDWTEQRQREATRMICCDMGRQAADEGWLIGLWDFCRKHERRPNTFEAEKVKRDSLTNWQFVNSTIREMKARGQDVKHAVQWKRMMKRKFRALKEKVYSKKEAA